MPEVNNVDEFLEYAKEVAQTTKAPPGELGQDREGNTYFGWVLYEFPTKYERDPKTQQVLEHWTMSWGLTTDGMPCQRNVEYEFRYNADDVHIRRVSEAGTVHLIGQKGKPFSEWMSYLARLAAY